MSLPLTISVIQLASTDNPDKNLDKALFFLEQASLIKTDVIVLPEYSNYMGPLSDAFDHGEGENGPWVAALTRFAGAHHTHIIAGLLMKGENGKAYSTLFSISGAGAVTNRYRKLHLFDIDLPGAPKIRESEYLNRGNGCVTDDVAGIRSGFAICYDLRFPELFRRLSAMSARVFYTVSAFTEKTGEAHWEILLRARAIENQAYVIAANQVGAYGEGKSSYGHSMIIDPWGRIIRRAPGPDDPQRETVITGTVDPALIDDTRRRLPCGEHIRKDLFGL